MKIGSNELLTAPPAPASTGSAGSAAGSNFAVLLQQSRAPALVAQPPAALPPVQARQSQPQPSGSDPQDATTETPPDGADEAPQADTTQTRPAPKPRARNNSNADTTATGRASHDARADGSARSGSTEAAARERADAASTSAPAEPKATSDAAALPNWLAALLPPQTPAAGTPSDANGGDAAATLDGADTAGTARGLALAKGRKADARDAMTAARAGHDATAATAAQDSAAAATPGFTAILAEQRHVEPAQRGDDTGTPRIETPQGAAALSAATPDATATAGASQDASGTTAAHVRAAVGSAEFPQELGVQLSVLARDGVQQAELHLNPAEMGPVSVQIVMDGTQAHIDFGADVAATRQAIEAGLPELASALRDAGFTLAGGGVSQHAGGRQGTGDDDASRRGSGRASRVGSIDASGATATARVVRTRVSAGGVDLYA